MLIVDRSDHDYACENCPFSLTIASFRGLAMLWQFVELVMTFLDDVVNELVSCRSSHVQREKLTVFVVLRKNPPKMSRSVTRDIIKATFFRDRQKRRSTTTRTTKK